MPGWYRPPHAARQISTFPLSFQSVVSSRWFFQPPFPSGIRWPVSSKSYALRHFAPHAPFSFRGRTVSMICTWGLPVPCHGWQSRRTSPCPQSCPSHRPGQGQAAVPWTVRGAGPLRSRGQGWLSLAFSICSTLFQRVERSANSGGAWAGSIDFRMDNAAFPGVIMGQAVPFIRQFGSASVGGCGNSGTALAALDDTDGDMAKIYGWHLLSAGIFQAPWSRTDAKAVFGCAGRTRVWGV